MKSAIKILIKGIPGSYSQIFFSDNKLFAVILILASFIDVWAGLAGLFAVVIVNVLGLILGFDKTKISKGLYGFNALLVGLGLGIMLFSNLEIEGQAKYNSHLLEPSVPYNITGMEYGVALNWYLR